MFYPDICLEGLKTIMKNFNFNTSCNELRYHQVLTAYGRQVTNPEFSSSNRENAYKLQHQIAGRDLKARHCENERRNATYHVAILGVENITS
jgi:hypothetical protein